MKRIDTDGRVVDGNGAGRDGFGNGNPVLGQEATMVDAAWLNAVQEEIARAVEASGQALDAGNYGQLAAAIPLLAAAAAMAAVEMEAWTVPGTYTWTKPAGTGFALIVATGGGGGGAGPLSTTSGVGASGGGAGVTEIGFWALSDLPESIAMTVGAGGGGTGTGSTEGQAGDPTTFGSLLLAPGGNGGYQGDGLFAPCAAPATNPASTALLSLPGGSGAPATNLTAGVGGDSIYGGGGRVGYQTGGNGQAPGAGGGGGRNQAGTRYAGGRGADGCLLSVIFSTQPIGD